MLSTGVIGASGFAGAELLRLLASHPELDVVYATGDTAAGELAADLYPALAAAYPDLRLVPYNASDAAGLDVVFCALPNGPAQDIVPDLLPKVGHILDLSADFRLKDASLYPVFYGAEHRAPALLETAVYGLPEFFRSALRDAPLVAVPGCYVTAAALALTPLVRAGVVAATGLIVDAASGVSGAGKGKHPLATVDDDFTAYGLLDHRHRPEMEQVIGGQVLFTPHLAPMSRGILATCYARPVAPEVDPLGVLREAYAGEPFIVVSERLPSTKANRGANTAHLTARYDERTGWVIVLCALDNMVKGAAGQAVQCANLAAGLPETLGLPTVGLAL
jgi:N-acetyl-gamma-glutamyl-phosphate reductase